MTPMGNKFIKKPICQAPNLWSLNQNLIGVLEEQQPGKFSPPSELDLDQSSC